jgi:hypothetical protein
VRNKFLSYEGQEIVMYMESDSDGVEVLAISWISVMVAKLMVCLRQMDKPRYTPTQTRVVLRLLIGNRAVNKLLQPYRLCFLLGPCGAYITTACSWY